jgi:ribosomal protein S18 acetylase RimI-like enzyme
MMSKTAVKIRDARPEEAGRVALLLRAAYQQYQKFMPPDAWQFYLADIMDVRGRLTEGDVMVAEKDERLVGTVTLYAKPSTSGEAEWPEGWCGVRLLGVDPQYRGMGIARALMDECLAKCRKHGHKAVGLHTAEIMDIAKGMYERMGFKRVPEFDFHPRPDVVIMAYKLDL